MTSVRHREVTVPLLVQGLSMVAEVSFPPGDYQDYDITGVYLDDSGQDILYLVDCAGWLDDVEAQVAQYMLNGDWRYTG